MPSLILKTRLEILGSNLRAVKDVMDLAKRRGDEIQALKELLFGRGGIRDQTDDVRTKIGQIGLELDVDDLKEEPRVAESLSQLASAAARVETLTESVRACHKALDGLLSARVELSTRRIQEKLETSIGECQELLDRSITDETVWADEANLSAKSEPLFEDYVDLLRGLALRESGIERGICELADRLLDGFDRTGTQWRSLAVPSHRRSSDDTPAQIIRLAFPEWTIWALPLAAHEFGRLRVRQESTLSGRVASDVQAGVAGEAILIDSLADAFATYTVGPAYACAAILMRLNPRPVNPGGPAVDDMRARMIFETLKAADRGAGLGVSFAGVLEPLEAAWAEALAEAGATGGAGGAEDLAAFFWKWAERSYVTAKYQPQSWQKAEKLKDVLDKRMKRLTLSADDEAVMTGALGDVRDMLNASWLFRLQSAGASGDLSDQIATEALAIWQEVNARPKKVARFGSHATAIPGVQRRTS